MLRKSVETRDWLNTIEPRTVRAVMKRVVEDVTAMDMQVCIIIHDVTTTFYTESLGFSDTQGKGVSLKTIIGINSTLHRILKDNLRCIVGFSRLVRIPQCN